MRGKSGNLKQYCQSVAKL